MVLADFCNKWILPFISDLNSRKQRLHLCKCNLIIHKYYYTAIDESIKINYNLTVDLLTYKRAKLSTTKFV